MAARTRFENNTLPGSGSREARGPGLLSPGAICQCPPRPKRARSDRYLPATGSSNDPTVQDRSHDRSRQDKPPIYRKSLRIIPIGFIQYKCNLIRLQELEDRKSVV